LFAYYKQTNNSKEKINLQTNLEACKIMYEDAKKILKSKRKIALAEFEEVNETLKELLTILQKYYKNLCLNGKISEDGYSAGI